MCSDQGQALERDNVFGDCDREGHMQVRELDPNNKADFVVKILQGASAASQFTTDHFVVVLGHGAPASAKFNVLKVSEAPSNKRELSGYLKKYKYLPTQERFANFRLLMFIAHSFDIDTALTIANSVATGTPLDEGIVSWIEQSC